MKKLITALTVLCMIFALLPCTVIAADTDPVTYIERSWDGEKVVETEKTASDYILITPETVRFEDGKTYVAKGSVKVDKCIESGKNVSIILMDDASFTPVGGIHISGSGDLTVYGQKNDSGTIWLPEEDECIIGNDTVFTNDYGAKITIHGGSIETDCVPQPDETGLFVRKGSIEIYGGYVDINSLDSAINDGGGTTKIYGGWVVASSHVGAGIGSSYREACGDISIYGGIVEATSYKGAGIGCGTEGSCRSVNIYGGNIYCYGFQTAAAIGSGPTGKCGSVNIYSVESLYAYSNSGYLFRGTREVGGGNGEMPDITLGKDVVLYYTDSGYEGDANDYVLYNTKNIKDKLKDMKFAVVYSIKYTERSSQSDGSVKETEKSTSKAIKITQNTVELNSSIRDTYFVNNNVTVSERIKVKGDIKLILTDRSCLNAPYGISVTEGNSLTIYADEDDMGSIIAKYGDDLDAAAIGGDAQEKAGDITIHGGNITAKGYRGAGIGAGLVSNGKVVILGGDIDCSSAGGAGIGKDVTIYGGNVVSKSDIGAGIGSGVNGLGGTVLITGGDVEASSKQGAGIGSGMRDANWFMTTGGTVDIQGGTVIASSGTGAAIGGGENSGAAEVTIGSGTVLNYGESAEETLTAADEKSGTPKEIGEKLGAAKYVKAEFTGNKGTGSVFSEGSVRIIIGCGALIAGAVLGLLIGKFVYGRKKIQG